MTDQDVIKAQAEIANLNAMTAKLSAETEKLHKETRWYEAVILTAVLTAGIALAKFVF